MARIHHYKLAVGALLAILALAILGGLFLLQFLIASNGGEATVLVVIQKGNVTLFNGTVALEQATALAALEAAAAEAGLDVETREYPGQGAYVRRIGPYTEDGAEGWLYCVGDPCAHPRLAADRYALRDGERVRWHWGTADDGLA